MKDRSIIAIRARDGIITQKSRTPRGFTLIELLVVIAIVGLLASLILVSFADTRFRARDARRLADLDAIKKALDLRFHNKEEYPRSPPPGPPTWTDSCSLPQNWIPKLVQEKYLGFLPLDPVNSSGKCYRYRGQDQNFKLAAFMEVNSNKEDFAATDGGVYDDWYEIFTPSAQNWAW